MNFKTGLTIAGLIALCLAPANARAERGFVIPSRGQYHDAISAVNLLLEESYPVYQLAVDLRVGGRTFEAGDYILPLAPPKRRLFNRVVAAVARDVLDRFGLERHPLPARFSTRAHRLREGNITVYYGKGTSAGALWHIVPAARAGFDVDIVRAHDVVRGDFAGGTTITFPSGGFYSGYLGAAGIAEVQEFVAEGNGLLGTCGGNVFGVEAGLLDAELVMKGPYPAAGDVRGPILLSNEAPAHPITRAVAGTLAPLYWAGQTYARVGPGVTILARYVSRTSGMTTYDPALTRAFGYTPDTAIMRAFWGKAAAIAGSYSRGKVVLTGTHPEVYSTTERFYLSALQYLNAGDEITLDARSLALLPAIRAYSRAGATSLDAVDQSVLGDLVRFLVLTLAARAHLYGLERDNEAITNGAGEFLLMELDDQIRRASRLLGDLFRMGLLHRRLAALDDQLAARRDDIPIELYRAVKHRIAASQSRIVAAVARLGEVSHHRGLARVVLRDTARFARELRALLAMRERAGETLEFYSKVSDLYVAQSATRDRVHNESEYFLLKAWFQTDAAIENAEGTSRLANVILSSI